jgi:hypothetical protein
MFFNCKISVVIGDKELKTVVSVSTKDDSAHIGSDCEIVVPLNCRIQYTNGRRDYLTEYAKNLFKSGDKVLIRAMYEGFDWVTVFDGYVVDFIEGVPIVIKCTDYVFLLNQTTVNMSEKSITLKNLVTRVLQGTGISLLEPTLELTLQNISFRLMSPAAILEWLKKELGINISLSGTNLYVNVASNTLDTVYYRTDRNVIASDLQKPDATYQKHKVKAWFIRENGTKDSFEVGDSNGQLHEVFFYRVQRNQAVYQKMAAEALTKVRQQKYNGSIETLLYPDCKLFQQANYVDIRYPARSANYVITGIDMTIDESGYHRKLKLSFLSEI